MTPLPPAFYFLDFVRRVYLLLLTAASQSGLHIAVLTSHDVNQQLFKQTGGSGIPLSLFRSSGM